MTRDADYPTDAALDAALESYEGAVAVRHPECCDALSRELTRLRYALEKSNEWHTRLTKAARELAARAELHECGLSSCQHCRGRK